MSAPLVERTTPSETENPSEPVAEVVSRGPRPGPKREGHPTPTPRRRWAFPGVDVGYALGIVVVLTTFLPARLVFPPLGAEGRPATILGILLLLWWLLSRLVPRLTPRGPQPFRKAIYVFLFAYFISYAAGFDRGLLPVEARATDRNVLATLSLVGIALAVSDGIQTRRRLDDFLRTIVVGVAFMAFVGVLQFTIQFDLVPLIKLPGLALNDELIGERLRGAALRVPGTAGHSIEFGVVCMLALPLALHYALAARTRNERIFRWLAVVLITTGSPFSGSRASYVGVAVIIVGMFIAWNARFRFQAAVISFMGLMVLRTLVPGLLGTIKYLFLNFGSDPSIEGRTDDYEIIFVYIKDRPFFGRGPGTFIPDLYIVLDNQVLLSLATIGFVGTLAFTLVFLMTLAQAGRVCRVGRDNETRHLAQALKVSILVGVFASVTFDSLAFATYATIWFLLFGAAAALWRIELQGNEPPDLRPSRFDRILHRSRLVDPSTAPKSYLLELRERFHRVDA